MESTGIIIVAGGSGSRAGGARPKQFRFLGGMPVLARTINTFAAALPGAEIVAVLPEQHIGFWKNLSARFDVAEHKIVAGGAERFHSVRNGLAALTSDPGLIAVQDGVRPLGSIAMIRRVAEAAARHGAAVPVVEPVDSFRETDADEAGNVASHIVDRRFLRIVQTPQIFRADVLRRAYEAEYRAEFTDDASVVEAIGQAVCLAEGERENLKLTTPGDFVVAEALIAAREEAENEEETTDAEHV
ncbi:2-C-methyl-D-erythritol 4-phosphate cytidylyltransferase [uncultured Alistipes sp.]|jgi:2-C-methyl-D-erythritol 4-phosphate cytidylyltransferase|uniref:2-C-methyl-D-erythritol 4-phosphate cytidylyltransferase n=1 Tax=uncultured Alistipes sp. TaxID=538949 RepID=UPI0025FA975C|nr:2-C-methyl-D-erythritol 4-phosphate cytidylyltransferase [uncultured Alistipes sp.]